MLSYPKLKQLRTGQHIYQVDGLSEFTGEIDYHVQTFSWSYAHASARDWCGKQTALSANLDEGVAIA
jgi:hypothetical protein